MIESGTRHRAAILTTVMLLSSRGTTPNHSTSESGGMLTWQQTNEKYKATVEGFSFELMNGDAFPANTPKTQTASSLHAEGGGGEQAYVYWQYSMGRDILDNSQTNAEAARDTLQQLHGLLGTDWFRNYYGDRDGIYENDAIDKSEFSDYSTIRDFYTADCTWYRHENELTK